MAGTLPSVWNTQTPSFRSLSQTALKCHASKISSFLIFFGKSRFIQMSITLQIKKILKNFKYQMSLKNHSASIMLWRQRSKVKVTFLKVNFSTHRHTLKYTLKNNFKITKRCPNMLATTYKKSGDVFFVTLEILNNVWWKTCKNAIFWLFYYNKLAGSPIKPPI